MLQQDEPGDYVIGTGEMHTVREFVELRLRARRIWTGSEYVEIDPRYFRPAEVEALPGGRVQGRERARLGAPGDIRELVQMMVDAELDELARAAHRAVLTPGGRRRASTR